MPVQFSKSRVSVRVSEYCVQQRSCRSNRIGRIEHDVLFGDFGVNGSAGRGSVVRAEFADGSFAEADLLIGADGIHSFVRTHLFGRERPRFSGNIAFRGLAPAERIAPPRVAEQQPWALLVICEAQNIEMLRNGTREKGDPLNWTRPRVPTRPLMLPTSREMPRNPCRQAEEHKHSYFALSQVE
jgi:2-polyprenyl-6-methoxyphenol hydroxylase-like FAD-dependent oxidoreductase